MKLFKIFNINIKINYEILALLFLSIFSDYFNQLLVLISVILVHELAHCFACIYYDIKIYEITIFIFGGVARFGGSMEEKPKEEIIIALAGPLSNFILIAITLFIIYIFSIEYNSILQLFLSANMTIGIFNLIPILPLDGGRVLRGIINSYLGIKKSTYIIIKLGYFICISLFVISIYLIMVYNIEYIFISFLSIYIFLSNKKEKERIDFIFTKNLILKKKALFNNDVMDVKNIIAMEYIYIKNIFNEFTLEEYCIISVTDKRGRVVGSLSESEIIDAILKYNGNITLGQILTSKL